MSRNHGNFIKACSEALKDSAIPEIYRTWSAISIVAGALGRRVWYDFGAYEVRPNLYIVQIGGPGSGKSLSLILPIDKLFRKLTTEPGTKEGQDAFNAELSKYGLQKSPLYLVTDRITPEKLSKVIAQTQRENLTLSTFSDKFIESPLTLVTSEFGTLVNRADNYLQMFLTGIWDSPMSYTYRTKTSGEDFLKGPCMNWIACATADQFVTHLPENARTQGLLSRMILVYYDGDPLPQSIYYPSPNYGQLELLREDLAAIASMTGEMKFEEGLREEVAAEVEDGISPEPTDPNLSEYLRRRPSHFVKVALSVSAAKSDGLVITREDWEDTKQLMFNAEKYMPAALAHFGVGKAGRLAVDMQDFLNYITSTQDRYGIPLKIFKQELMRKVSNPLEVEQMVKVMEESGLINVEGPIVIPNVIKKPTKSKGVATPKVT